MEIFKVVLLGIIEGLTEFIPVSSTGHLIIIEKILKLETNNAHTFQIAIQLGAISAVFFSYKSKILKLYQKKEDFIRLIQNLIIAAIPVFIIGFLSYGYIKENLFSPLTVALALITGSLGMLFVELKPSRKPKTSSLEEISMKQAFIVGIFQIFALWPGMSRSGATIIGGVFMNLTHRVSADFSFLLALPVISAAVLYDLLKSFDKLTGQDLIMILIGGVVSFIVALFAIKTFLKWLDKVRLFPFAIYRIVLALVVLTFYL
tara:strand:- start:193 stop:975 length:783 start_codon:yes stop_codon:yes gene_type:complete